MHLFHRMFMARPSELVATNEIMQLHVNQKAGKVVPDAQPTCSKRFPPSGRAHKKLKKPANSAG